MEDYKHYISSPPLKLGCLTNFLVRQPHFFIYDILNKYLANIRKKVYLVNFFIISSRFGYIFKRSLLSNNSKSSKVKAGATIHPTKANPSLFIEEPNICY